jgi:hypothetical protein
MMKKNIVRAACASVVAMLGVQASASAAVLSVGPGRQTVRRDRGG